MKNKIFRVVLVLTSLFSGIAHSGAEIVVNLTTGEEFKWQFMDMDNASMFLADRINSGKCSPKIISVTIRSVYIDGIDDEYSWYHSVDKTEF
jgi:hypothetical protein